MHGVVLRCGDNGHEVASMDDNWMTDVLHRVDERCARDRPDDGVGAGPFSAIYWLVFFAVTLVVPVGLWHYNLQFTGLIGPTWQSLVERLAG